MTYKSISLSSLCIVRNDERVDKKYSGRVPITIPPLPHSDYCQAQGQCVQKVTLVN